jgi:flagellar export protein FliJ
MRKFEFRLARVLQWRESILKTEQAALQNARARKALMLAELDSLKRSAAQAGSAVKASEWVSAAELAHLHHFHRRVERESAGCKARITAQEELIAKQEANVVIAQRNVRLLEKLRDQKLQDWQIESIKDAEAVTQDFISAQWARRKHSRLNSN